MSDAPWNNWYHCMGNTYGTWLPGDPRGFRTVHHREHVEGDYKNPPPPGKYEEWLVNAKSQMSRDAVFIPHPLRRTICFEFVARLVELKVEVVEVCVTETHYHLLARFTPIGERVNVEVKPRATMPGLSTGNMLRDGRDPVPRHCCGLAKKHTSFVARDHGMTGGLWAEKGKILPIRDRAHQVNTVKYIQDHIHEGGVIWSMIKPR